MITTQLLVPQVEQEPQNNSPLINRFLPRKKVTEGTSLISYVISHVTEETGVKHAKEDFENDTDFDAIPIPTIHVDFVDF